MPQLPFQLRYELSRRDRLIPHLRIWRLYAVVPLGALLCFAGSLATSSWWLAAVMLFVLLLCRGFLLGILGVLLVPLEPMDIVVERNGLGFLAGKERWYFALDGLTAFGELARGVWTVQHWNGSVVNIPKGLLDDEQVEFFRSWVNEANAIRRRLGIRGSAAA
jgi:hypothetical protein